MELHDDGVLARSIVVPSQTPFFKFELPIKLSRWEVRTANFQRNYACSSRFSLVYCLSYQNGAYSEPPRIWMHCDVQDVALVGNQPSAEKAGDRAAVGRKGDHDSREWEGQLALKRRQRPRRREREPLDLHDARQVARCGVPNVDRHLNSTRENFFRRRAEARPPLP